MRRYSKIPIKNNSTIKEGVRFYINVKYPEIPLAVNDIYVITQAGDRYNIMVGYSYS